MTLQDLNQLTKIMNLFSFKRERLQNKGFYKNTIIKKSPSVVYQKKNQLCSFLAKKKIDEAEAK